MLLGIDRTLELTVHASQLLCTVSVIGHPDGIHRSDAELGSLCRV